MWLTGPFFIDISHKLHLVDIAEPSPIGICILMQHTQTHFPEYSHCEALERASLPPSCIQFPAWNLINSGFNRFGVMEKTRPKEVTEMGGILERKRFHENGMGKGRRGEMK